MPSFDDAFAEFDYVWRSLLRLGVPMRDAEDLAQEVFVVVHRRLAEFDPKRPLRPWLFGICANVARGHRKKAATRKERLGEVCEQGRASEDVARLEAAQLIWRALESVEENRREALILFELDGTPMEEVAAALGIPVSTAYARVRKGREELRLALKREGA